eukprot:CAMPEP_0177787292 /NCGR_PEP_ID=MMETSP0491_2-20121128/21404_1 /TAXON_ID=63592 /ORGANISM="Tetraselmis chuii, Strain PLY429" /LENGTH=59 /DNA_ID=CAMNT_0019308611 /DNA_START=63 /DNA_END=238 /DNA_ORIENTATION=-
MPPERVTVSLNIRPPPASPLLRCCPTQYASSTEACTPAKLSPAQSSSEPPAALRRTAPL